MTSKLIRAASPPPFLKTERSADYERLLGRLEAELKPTDIMEEFYVYDIAYWTWDLWRWRRIKTCLIDHKFFNAFQWTSILLPTQRLAHIGKTDQLDAKNVAKKTEEYQEKIAALGPEFDEVFGKEEHTDELSETLADIASTLSASIK